MRKKVIGNNIFCELFQKNDHLSDAFKKEKYVLEDETIFLPFTDNKDLIIKLFYKRCPRHFFVLLIRFPTRGLDINCQQNELQLMGYK